MRIKYGLTPLACSNIEPAANDVPATPIFSLISKLTTSQFLVVPLPGEEKIPAYPTVVMSQLETTQLIGWL